MPRQQETSPRVLGVVFIALALTVAVNVLDSGVVLYALLVAGVAAQAWMVYRLLRDE